MVSEKSLGSRIIVGYYIYRVRLMPFPAAFFFFFPLSCGVVCGGRQGRFDPHSRLKRAEVTGGEWKAVGRGRGTFMNLSFCPMLSTFHV